jgi:small subunit ribosomal protein S2
LSAPNPAAPEAAASTAVAAPPAPPVATTGNLVRDLIDAGIHFGHRASKWNPKMAPYIFGKQNLIHIINVKETIKGLIRAKRFLAKLVGEGKDVLFVGTKRQAQAAVVGVAERTGMHCCTERWLGGTLSNYRTIRSRLSRLEELENAEANNFPNAGSKKAESTMKRELRKIRRNLSGIRRMDRMPGCLVVIDPNREKIAVKEAKKLGIPTVCLIDTDSDPDTADLPIPGNDDAMRAIEIILKELGDAIEEGKAGRPVREEQGPRGDRRDRQRGRAPMGRGGARSDRGPGGPGGDRGGRRGDFADKPGAAPAPAPAPAAPPPAPPAPPAGGATA